MVKETDPLRKDKWRAMEWGNIYSTSRKATDIPKANH